MGLLKSRHRSGFERLLGLKWCAVHHLQGTTMLESLDRWPQGLYPLPVHQQASAGLHCSRSSADPDRRAVGFCQARGTLGGVVLPQLQPSRHPARGAGQGAHHLIVLQHRVLSQVVFGYFREYCVPLVLFPDHRRPSVRPLHHHPLRQPDW